MSAIQNIHSFHIEKNGKLQILINGDPVELKDVISMDIHIEHGVITLQTERIDRFKFADSDGLIEAHMPATCFENGA